MNIKVFNLTSATNETGHIEWHDTYKCKARLYASVCNNKQRWNKGKCKCETNFKFRNKLVDKLVEECSENIDQNKMIYDKTLNDYGKYWLCNSCTIYTVFVYPLCHCFFL